MPASSHTVSLRQAKQWAKRLAAATQSLTPQHPMKLSQAQQAVAMMLGFEHWHALNHALLPSPKSISSVVKTPRVHPISLPSDQEDELFKGIEHSSLVAISGRAGEGKTSFLSWLLSHPKRPLGEVAFIEECPELSLTGAVSRCFLVAPPASPVISKEVMDFVERAYRSDVDSFVVHEVNTPEHVRFVNSLLASGCKVICTSQLESEQLLLMVQGWQEAMVLSTALRLQNNPGQPPEMHMKAYRHKSAYDPGSCITSFPRS